MRKKTIEEFIEMAKKVHGDKYDYSKTEYVNNHTKVCIICPEHGEFWQTPDNHLSGQRCPKCYGNIKNTTEEFIEKAKQVHGDKYDYSKVEYMNYHTKVCIICPIHGEFWQTPANHLMGKGCSKCGIINATLKRRSKNEEFINKAKEVHGNKYDYSKVDYVNHKTKVCIICLEHGEFYQTPNSHLSGNGCPKCGGSLKFTQEEFISKAKQAHGDKYDYSKVEYINANTKVCIVCPIHGEFWQTPYAHLSGQGCRKCAFDKNAKNQQRTIEEFVEMSNKVHNNKYVYSKVEYVNTDTKVCIICPIHGEFWQTPYKHLNGQGCPKCNQSKLENEIMQFLKDNNIEFIPQHSFEWLTYKNKMSLDFYLPKYNIGIECQGRQHFIPIKHFGGEEGLNEINDRDKSKKELCDTNGVKLLYYSNLGIEYPYKVYENKEELLIEILKQNKNE